MIEKSQTKKTNNGNAKELINITIVIMIVAGILTLVETSVGRKSAWALYALLMLSMLLTQPLLLSRFANIVGNVTGSK